MASPRKVVYALTSLLLSILLLARPAGAQVCCPAGCVQDNNACVTTGPPPHLSCGTVACNSPPAGSGTSGSGGGGVSVYNPSSGGCPDADQATQAAATNKCIADLTANAEFWGCLFEDAAGKAEDRKLNMTCAERKAAYAQECRSNCALYANMITNGCEGGWLEGAERTNYLWKASFAGVGGTKYGAARVEGCGPPPKKKPGGIGTTGPMKPKNVP